MDPYKATLVISCTPDAAAFRDIRLHLDVPMEQLPAILRICTVTRVTDELHSVTPKTDPAANTAAANKKLPPMASAYNVPPLPGEVPVYRIPIAADVDTEAQTCPPPMPRGGPRTLAELIIEIKEAREASSILEILAYSDETRELLRDLEAAERCRGMLCDKGEAGRNEE